MFNENDFNVRIRRFQEEPGRLYIERNHRRGQKRIRRHTDVREERRHRAAAAERHDAALVEQQRRQRQQQRQQLQQRGSCQQHAPGDGGECGHSGEQRRQ